MALANWKPTEMLSPLGLDILDWFEDPGEDSVASRGDGFCPSVESYVKDSVVHFRAEIPGVNPKDMSVTIDDGHLCFRGERKRPESAENSCYCFDELDYGSFVRCFHLPEHVDADKVQAKYDNGILDVTVPLSKESMGTTIPIEGIEEKT